MIASPAVSYPAAPLTPEMIFAHFKGVAKSILSQRWKYTATEYTFAVWEGRIFETFAC